MTVLVAVVGSANLDIVLTVPQRPAAGETVLGSGYAEAAGGKGANQAIGAAAVVSTAFVGSVGRDSGARLIESALTSAGVAIDRLAHDRLPTGRAYITLTPDGENSIVVIPLANTALSPTWVTAALDALAPTVVLTQLEVPESVTEAVVAWCGLRDVRLVLNASPSRALTPESVRQADPLVVNEVEAYAILGPTEGDTARLALALARHSRSVVLTAGARGAYVARGQTVHHVAGERVTAVDTTGAGDVFVGTLAGHLAGGSDLIEAAAAANRAAALLVQRHRADR